MAIERDHLKRVSNVVIHFRYLLQAMFQQFVFFLCPQPVLKKKGACDHPSEQIAKEHDTHTWNTFLHQKAVKAKTHGRDNNDENEDGNNVPVVRFQHWSWQNLG